MKKTFRILLVLTMFCFLTQIPAQAAKLPDSGKKIIEKYLNGLGLSFNFGIGAENINAYGLGLHGDSFNKFYGSYMGNQQINLHANVIYRYMLSKGFVTKTRNSEGRIILGEYKIKSIDKVKMDKRGEYNIYKVAFSYIPVLRIGKFPDINNPKYVQLFKGFSTLVYDRFKDQWIVREDMGRAMSAAGDQLYDLLEIKEDPFALVFKVTADIANDPCSSAIEDHRNLRVYLETYYADNNSYPTQFIKDGDKFRFGDSQEVFIKDAITISPEVDMSYKGDTNKYSLITTYPRCANSYSSTSSSDGIKTTLK